MILVRGAATRKRNAANTAKLSSIFRQHLFRAFPRRIEREMRWAVLQELPIGPMLIPIMETRYVNTGMCKFESSQKMKAERSRMIPRKLAENLEFLIVYLLHSILSVFVSMGIITHVAIFHCSSRTQGQFAHSSKFLNTDIRFYHKLQPPQS